MKKTLITIVGCFVFGQLISQDYRADVRTPNGSTVEAWVTMESTIYTREYYDYYFSNNYPNAEKIVAYDNLSSTRRFNCHGYAWHMSELTNPLSEPRWIGYPELESTTFRLNSSNPALPYISLFLFFNLFT